MPGPARWIMLAPDFWARDDVNHALRDRDIGALFRIIQKYSGASQTKIANAVGMTHSMVSTFINGKRQVTSLDVYERIALGLDMPDPARLALGLAPHNIPTPPPSATPAPPPAQPPTHTPPPPAMPQPRAGFANTAPGARWIIHLDHEFWSHPATLAMLTARDVAQLLRTVQRLTEASQTQIGVAIGIAQGEVSDIMSGGPRRRRILSADLLTRIATGLGMPDHAAATLLLGRVIQPSTPPATPAPAQDDDEDLDDDTDESTMDIPGLSFGPTMRVLRRAAGLSTRALADKANYSHAAIGHAETGRRTPTKDFAAALDNALNANGQLIETAATDRTTAREHAAATRARSAGVDARHSVTPHAPAEQPEITTALTGALISTSEADYTSMLGFFYDSISRPSRPSLLSSVEQLRRQFGKSLDQHLTAAQVDDLEKSTLDSAEQSIVTPPLEMVARLAVDLTDVQAHIDGRNQPSIQEALFRVAARLAALIADDLMVLGEASQSRAWHSMARFAADQTRDGVLRADIRVLGSLLYLYYGNPRQALELAQDAKELAGGNNSLARALAPLYEAFAYARLDSPKESELALLTARHRYASIDPNLQMDSVFGLSPSRWRFYEGKILSHLGRSEEAWVIHAEALALYPSNATGDRTLILLDRATSLVRDRQIEEGCKQAEDALAALPVEHRADLFTHAAHGVLDAIPPGSRDLPLVNQYRMSIRSFAAAAATVIG